MTLRTLLSSSQTWLRFPVGERFRYSKPGPDKKEWDAYVGKYWVDVWGKPSHQLTVLRKNGYLYLDKLRLAVEHQPGLFFASDGEAVDFRGRVPTARCIPLRRAPV